MANQKTMPAVSDTVYVQDKKGKGPYECTVLEVDDAQSKILIHWTGCGKKFDEWITVDRIVSPPVSKSNDPDVVKALNELSKIDPTVDKVIQVYSPDKSIDENEKKLYSTFSVNNVQLCAGSLNIDLADDKGKSIRKMELIKSIVVKIMSMLPMTCQECMETYKLDVNEVPLVSCFLCGRPSHNCEAFENLKSTLPTLNRLGFRFVCTECSDLVPSLPEAGALPEDRETNINESAKDKTEPKDGDARIREEKLQQKPAVAKDSSLNQEITETPVTSPKSIPICQRFRRGQCPHGLKGNKLVAGEKCAYAHPRKCRKFLSAGNDKRYGCGQGKGCKFLHPILCPSSGKGDGVCSSKSCKLFHLKRARRSIVSPESRSSHSRVGGNTNRKAATTATASTPSKNDQLERIEQMILSMKTTYDKELKALRQQLSQGQSPPMSWMVPNYPWMTPPFGGPTPLTSFQQQVPTSYSH